jgi:hypothetical protein
VKKFANKRVRDCQIPDLKSLLKALIAVVILQKREFANANLTETNGGWF